MMRTKENKNPAKGRRYHIDKWHPYGWKVSFTQTIKDQRVFCGGLGMTRTLAIHNALRGKGGAS